MIDYNMETLNRYNLAESFFHLSRDDPMQGFAFDATKVAGHTYPAVSDAATSPDSSMDEIELRLKLGSHFALYLRHQLEEQKGYSSTVGIATNKLLSKLVGSVNKPKAQTTLMPPLSDTRDQPGNAVTFLDDHEIGKIPGIGFKSAQKLRELVLQRSVKPENPFGLMKEQVTVSAVRNHPDVNYESLETLLGGPGSPYGIGYRVWCLLHGVDDSEVSQAKPVPSQISIEDSYLRLDTMPELLKELGKLSYSLIKRMRVDLTVEDEDPDLPEASEQFESIADDTLPSPVAARKWLAHPRTIRLTTRPRMPLRPDGTRERTMKRISHSCPLPNYIFNLQDSIDAVAEKLVNETLITMFRRLHHERSGWNLSLVNVAVTNMAETAGESKTANGRDIGNMFKMQDDVLKDFRVVDAAPDPVLDSSDELVAPEMPGTDAWAKDERDVEWVEDGDGDVATEYCDVCHSTVPSFAMVAHQRFHIQGM